MWFKKKVKQKSEYSKMLVNSINGLSGCRFSGDGPFMSLEDLRQLIKQELERQPTTGVNDE